MRTIVFLSLCIILICCSSPLLSGSLVAMPNEDQPMLYDFDWSDCTFEEVLRDLYLGFKVETFAVAFPDSPKSEPTRAAAQFPGDVITGIGISCSRGRTYIGSTHVFLPCSFSALSTATQAAAAQLVCSLSDDQLQFHAKHGGLPFKVLNRSQRERAYFIAANDTRSVKYPESELSAQLESSALILAFNPSIRFVCEVPDESGQMVKGGYVCNCNRDVSAEFWQRHAPGQIAAAELAKLATTMPDVDCPGGETTYALDGTYLLADLLQLIQKDTEGRVRAGFDATKVRVSAYYTMTGAALARACSAATGQAWTRKGTDWVLAGDFLEEGRELFGDPQKSGDYLQVFYNLQPQLARIARSKAAVLAVDPQWNEVSLVPAMLDMAEIQWSSLRPDQQAYLSAGARMYAETPGGSSFDLASRLPTAKLWWIPHLTLYIVTESSVLFQEHLGYVTTDPPDHATSSTGSVSDAD